MGRLEERWAVDPLGGQRRPTREVRVGDVGIGGGNPIRIQSMTTTDTRDTGATVDQIGELARAGCEIVRVTAPSITDAENLEAIRREMAARGIRVPLVADIHFTPKAALVAAEFVEKVRINPGNYADKKRFEVREYDDATYRAELERVAERFRPLVRRCRERGVAMRIGTNHGSLSDRIMNRYGDTPAGMVESALEFLDVCEDESFHDVVFSMKASNARVAIQAYRLLAARLDERAGGGPIYPLHVGVTEAGDGEDGRVKSAIGIGSLLEDGLGDTIRVSLTESPVEEIPVARALVARVEARRRRFAQAEDGPAAWPGAPFDAVRRGTDRVCEASAAPLGDDEPVRVELDLGRPVGDPGALAARLALLFAAGSDRPCEGLVVELPEAGDLEALQTLVREWKQVGVEPPLALACPGDGVEAVVASGVPVSRVEVDAEDPALERAAHACATAGLPLALRVEGEPEGLAARLETARGRLAPGCPWLVSVASAHLPQAARAVAMALDAAGEGRRAILLRHRDREGEALASLLDAAVSLGAPLCDGIGDAVVASAGPDPVRSLDRLFRILQGARLRSTRTEYISCPSCGRTLFDLEETTARIKARTDHLPGVKIAVMGCIVNGPGEMADADFGYVGSGPGKVSLWVGKEVVERHVPEDEAPERLVELIRSHGRWRDPGDGDARG